MLTGKVSRLYVVSLCAVAEAAGGVANNNSPMLKSDAYWMVVKSVTIDFVKPAKTDIEAVVEISDQQVQAIKDALNHTGKAEWSLDVTLHDMSDDVLASVHANYYASAQR